MRALYARSETRGDSGYTSASLEQLLKRPLCPPTVATHSTEPALDSVPVKVSPCLESFNKTFGSSFPNANLKATVLSVLTHPALWHLRAPDLIDFEPGVEEDETTDSLQIVWNGNNSLRICESVAYFDARKFRLPSQLDSLLICLDPLCTCKVGSA